MIKSYHHYANSNGNTSNDDKVVSEGIKQLCATWLNVNNKHNSDRLLFNIEKDNSTFKNAKLFPTK